MKVDTVQKQLRIDFAKYGPKVAGQKRVDDSKIDLPDDIYCDLINSLKDVCFQSSLLEIWQYDRYICKFCDVFLEVQFSSLPLHSSPQTFSMVHLTAPNFTMATVIATFTLGRKRINQIHPKV